MRKSDAVARGMAAAALVLAVYNWIMLRELTKLALSTADLLHLVCGKI